MSERYPGGFITKNAPQPTGGEDGVADGIWTLEQALEYKQAGNWPSPLLPKYIEDVFSTYLYTGNSSTQTITNGIDLSTKGGLVWAKCRTLAANHRLTDTVRGAGNSLISNSTLGTQTATGNGEVSSFTTTGYTTNLSGFNSTDTHVSWTFREQPKFFDIVTYTGDGAASRNIAHSLGATPGCIICKATSISENWGVYHRSTGANGLYLNGTNSAGVTLVPTGHTSTTFEVADGYGLNNVNGVTYVAYLFAHNAGGFGTSGSDNVISCGSFTTDGSGLATVNLGYEPQWVMVKRTDGAGSWFMHDTMRGYTATTTSGTDAYLLANTSGAEVNTTAYGGPNATGFTAYYNPSQTYIYIAIRRGPMKTPTTGTSVFDPVLLVDGSTNLPPVNSTINAPDLAWSFARNAVYGYGSLPRDRLSSAGISYLETSSTAAEVSYAGNTFGFTRLQKGIDGANAGSTFNQASPGTIYWMFGRAPGFFDVVCYTGTGSATTFSHNLGVAPELMIVKSRSAAKNWGVYAASLGNGSFLNLNTTSASGSTTTLWNSTSPTSSVFTVGTALTTNENTTTYVAYLFASVSGVSKVGSYTGTGALQTVNCGFTTGARFVLIKRTDSTGDWYVYDSARGISSGNDPYLLLNSAAAEVTGTNYVDTTSVGFQVTAAAPAELNANGGTYIFLAIA